MPFFDSIRLGGASSADPPYAVDRSLRLNDNDSAYITRTPSTEGNRRKWTLSLWFKRGNLGSNQNLFSTSGTDDRGFFDARFQSNDTLTIGIYTNYVLQTNQTFRDPSAWYHMVIVLDSGQGSASDRLKLYINGSEVTSFSLDNRATFITVNQSFGINSTNAFEIGRHALDSNKYFDGYIAEINFIDGQALTPSSFGETNSTTGQWNPKEYEGTYAKTGSASNGTTWVSGSSNNNNQVEANAFNGIPTSSAADAGSMYQTPLNGSYTLTPSTSFTVNSNLSFQMYANVANFDTYSSVFVNGSEVTMSLVTGTNQSTNDGVWSSNFTGTVNNFGLSSHPTSINAIAQVIVDGEVLINGFNDNGKNSFYLQFADNSGTSATTLGKDTSGQSNNFTPNNFAVSDAVKDSPTNNFCNFNSLNNYDGLTLAEGNLKATSSSSWKQTRGTMGVSSGKWYFEIRCNSIATTEAWIAGIHEVFGRDTDGYYWYNNSYTAAGFGYAYGVQDNNKKRGNTSSMDGSFSSDVTAGKVVGVRMNLDDNEILISVDGVDKGKMYDIQSGITYAPAVNIYGSSSATLNCGQDSTFHGQETAGGNSDGGGIGDFAYAVPSGYKALCSANLSTPTIQKPNKHFDTFLYSGNNNATRTFSNVLEFQTDFFWTKARNVGYAPIIIDSVRGTGQLKSLATQSNAEEGNELDNATYGYVNSFDATGFSVTKGSASSSFTNESGKNYVTWNINAGDTDGKTYAVTVVSDSGNKYRFDGFGTSAVTLDLAEGGTYVFDWSDSSAQSHPIRFSTTSDGTHGGGSEYTTGVVKDDSAYKTTITVAASAPTLYYYCQYHSGMGGQVNTNSTLGSSNFDGTIQSVAKANTTAGFSIVGYTGTGSNATVGHGLGVTPKFIITKQRSTSGHHWRTYHHTIGATKSLYFDLSNAVSGSDAGFMNNTEPTSSVFTIGNDTNINESSQTHIAYCFSEVAGYSKFGSYTGNGSNSGVFVYLGFRPAFIIIKGTADNTSFWTIVDNKRNEFNPVNKWLYSNDAQAEYDASSYPIEFFANGFRVNTNASYTNTSGGNYIYLAIAESPFKNARAR